MGTHLFNRHTIWTVFFSLLIALGLGACSDVSNAPAPITPPSPESSLFSLTVSPGTLQPVFSSSVTGYTVEVASSITSVTVSAQTLDPGASASINGGTASTNPSRPVPLGAAGSSTQVLIVVTAPNGSQNTYSVTVNRSGGSNDLQSLTVSSGALSPTFSASETSYTVNVASNIGSVSITATLQDALANMTVNGQATNSGQPRNINLNPAGSPTFVTIVVTAPNGNPKTYTVTVNRTAFASDNNLSALSVTGQTLAPVFDAGTQNYTVAVATGVASVTVSATKSDPNATMSGSVSAGVGQATGQATITLNGPGSSTSILITVTAPSGSSKPYAITVNRAAPASDSTLSALSVTIPPSSTNLISSFTPGTLSYPVNVASTVASVTVSATKSDPSAVMSGSVTAGVGVATGQAIISLPNGPSSTPVSIVVVAPNGSQSTYTITVNRAAPASDSTLSALSVTIPPSSTNLISSFTPGTLSYPVNVASTVASVTVSATKSDPSAVMSGSVTAGVGVATGQAIISLPNGPSSTPVSIVVVAPNGSQSTYTITVNRAAAAPPSTNAKLSSLTVNAGTLSPAFVAPGVFGLPGYTVAVPNATTSITLTAVKDYPAANLVISPAATVNPLPVGDTLFSILVTAEAGNSLTYFVTVTRGP